MTISEGPEISHKSTVGLTVGGGRGGAVIGYQSILVTLSETSTCALTQCHLLEQGFLVGLKHDQKIPFQGQNSFK